MLAVTLAVQSFVYRMPLRRPDRLDEVGDGSLQTFLLRHPRCPAGGRGQTAEL